MDRTPREQQTREKTAARKPWAPPNRLDAPEPPPGYVHRWIRTEMRGEEDKVNVHARLREGWEPVRKEEHPDFEGPTIEDGRFAGTIGTGGLMLVRMPIETVNERRSYYGQQTRVQMESVDQDLMREQHPAMPIHTDRQTRVTFGGRPSDSA